MRLLFLSSLYPPKTKGGGEISTHLIAQGLVKRGHSVTVITDGLKRSEQYIDGVEVLHLPLNLTAKPLFEHQHSKKIAVKLDKVIRDPKNYDVIHAHDFRTALALSELNYKNTVVTARDYAQICGSPNNILADGTTCPGCTINNVLKNRSVVEAPLLRKPFRIWQYRYNINYRLKSFRKYQHQIFISHAQQKEIAKIQDLSGIKTDVVYNPIAPAYLDLPAVHAISRDLLYIGTIASYKGVGLLLNAFKDLAKLYDDIHLNIVGAGEGLKEYQKKVADDGLQYRVTFKGHISWDRLQPLYDSSLIVVAPHLWVEPFGRTVIEAMARAKAVVAANLGGPSETIIDNDTGFLFTAGSKSDLVRRVTDVIEMSQLERRQVQRQARQWVHDNLTPEKIAVQHEQIYQDII